MSTMREVAARAGVSVKTVSRVFNDDPHVLPDTRERVQAALRELSYVPNDLPSTLRAGRAPVIGIAVPDIVDPFFASITHSIQSLAFERGMFTLVTSLGVDPELEKPMVEGLLKRGLSGLVLAPITADQSYLSVWSTRLPVVFVDRQPAKLAADSFTEDDEGGADAATTHLIEHGHRRIAFLGEQPILRTAAGRLAGYRAALERAGLPENPELMILGVGDRPGARDALAALRDLPEPPTAVFSSNARCTMALLPALRPHEFALVGFGDFPMADVVTPAVSVIDQDPYRLGRLAAERIFDRLDAPDRRYRRRTVVPVRLIERASCSAAPAG